MTWQGGKLRREQGETLSFARLRTLARPQDDAAKGINQLSKALSGLGKQVRLHIGLVSGPDAARVQHWDVQGGAKSGKVKRGKPKEADVVVVMRPETWAEIAQGQLAPYEALYSGKLRVGGDFEMAKAIVKHLMAETIGKITNIKVMSFLPGTVNAFDIANISVRETSTGQTWLFHLWQSRDDDTPVHRVVESQRLALVRDAAFRKLTVHVFAQPDSGFVDGIQVDTP